MSWNIPANTCDGVLTTYIKHTIDCATTEYCINIHFRILSPTLQWVWLCARAEKHTCRLPVLILINCLLLLLRQIKIKNGVFSLDISVMKKKCMCIYSSSSCLHGCCLPRTVDVEAINYQQEPLPSGIWLRIGFPVTSSSFVDRWTSKACIQFLTSTRMLKPVYLN